MTYIDGAIVRNNPVRLAYEEANRIWKSGARPDIVLSLGTGIQIDNQGKFVDAADKKLERVIRILPKKYATIAKVALDMVQSTIDCNREWIDFKSSGRGDRDRRHFHRLDVGLLFEKPPSIDDVEKTTDMWTKSQDYFRKTRSTHPKPGPYIHREYQNGLTHLRLKARRLLAVLFYLSNEINGNIPAGIFRTNLCCRLPPQSDGALNILVNRPNFRLKEVDINGESQTKPVRILLPEILDEQTLLGPIELDISEGQFTRTVEVQFPRRGNEWEPIGGF
ncbi:hypothetical protein GGR58DRAFT_285643 [Xylaria digitata]|nr:hypothetical protein GGR58DRAFT_285643 [Xylaria digitata]